jgi:hypothetical protein
MSEGKPARVAGYEKGDDDVPRGKYKQRYEL